MANVYVVLPVPAGDGVGAGVNTSGLAPDKTLSVDGGPFTGTLYIESSNDNQVSWAPVDVLPFTSDAQIPGKCESTAQFMRVRRVGTGPVPSGTPTVKVGAEIGANVFGAMAVPVGSGVGALIDLSAGGSVNTFNVVGVGPVDGQLIIDVSDDAGATWSPAILFDSLGKVGQNYNGIISSARVRRTLVVGSGATPAVSVGSGDPSGSGFAGFAAPLQNWVNIKPGVAATAARSDSQTTSFPSPDSFVVFCVDQDNLGGLGVLSNDATAQPGYAPSTGVPATDMATALAAAKLLPFKTLERVSELLPRYGNNATVVVLVRPRAAGATYKKKDTVTDQPSTWADQTHGWKRALLPRPTLNFANDTADKVAIGYLPSASGFVTSATGYNAGAGSTASLLANCVINGGGAPGWPLEVGGTSAIMARRIRFDPATVTVALRNATAMVWKNNATDLTCSDNLPAVPAGGDVFFLEEAGLRVGAGQMTLGLNGDTSIVGFRNVTGSMILNVAGGSGFAATLAIGSVNICGVESVSTIGVTGGNNGVQCNRQYIDELGANITAGISIRSDGAPSFNGMSSIIWNSGAGLSATARIAISGAVRSISNFGSGCIARCGVTNSSGAGGASPFVTQVTPVQLWGNNSSGTQQKLRVTSTPSNFGALVPTCLGVAIRGVDISNQTRPCIISETLGGGSTIDDVVSTDGGNTDVVLDVSQSKDSHFIVGLNGAVTATAALGDMRVSGGAICTFATLAIANIHGPDGNNIEGAAGNILSGRSTQAATFAGGTAALFTLVRSTGVSGAMAAAVAGAPPGRDAVGVCINAVAAGAVGLVVDKGWCPVLFTAAPTVGNVAYLSLVAGQARDTPVGVADVRLGRIVRAIAGNYGIVNLGIDTETAPVLSVLPGTGITVTGTAQNPVVNNAGVLSVTAGTGITLTGTAANPIVNASPQQSASMLFFFNGTPLSADVHALLPSTTATAPNGFGGGGSLFEWLAPDFNVASFSFDCNLYSNATVVGGGNWQMRLTKNNAGSTVLFSKNDGVITPAAGNAAFALTADTDTWGLQYVNNTSGGQTSLQGSLAVRLLPT
jgi:hypothetical protein